MDFLNLIRAEICHVEAIQLLPGPPPRLYCHQCQKDIIGNIYDYISRPDPVNYFRSSALAQAYAAWTGDVQVPISFPVTDIEGIHDCVNIGQPLHRVRKSVGILRALNAPFTDQPSERTHLDNQFLTEFLHIVYEHPKSSGGGGGGSAAAAGGGGETTASHERMALDALIKSMHKILTATANPFDTYFNVLVPYVQACVPATTSFRPFPAEKEDANLARELYVQLIRSFQIRKRFGKYAIPFDVLHVMACCYACSNNMDLVGNWALDFLIRTCRGEFFWAAASQEVNPFLETMQRLVAREYSYRKKTDYYQSVIKPIRSGESIEHYSQMWQPLHEMQVYLHRRFTVPGVSQDVLDVAFTHCFPALLFTKHPDQLGFTMGYNHLIMTMNRRNGHLPKGAFKQAKRVHGVVQRFVERVLQFEGNRPIIWTLDTVKLFFASDPHFEEEMMQVIQMIVTDVEEEEEEE